MSSPYGDRKGFWKTKAGEYVKITELGDRHLKNIIKMLYRKVPEYRDRGLTMCMQAEMSLQGEQALLSVESAERGYLEGEDDEILREFVPQWSDLLAEDERRGRMPGYWDEKK